MNRIILAFLLFLSGVVCYGKTNEQTKTGTTMTSSTDRMTEAELEASKKESQSDNGNAQGDSSKEQMESGESDASSSGNQSKDSNSSGDVPLGWILSLSGVIIVIEAVMLFFICKLFLAYKDRSAGVSEEGQQKNGLDSNQVILYLDEIKNTIDCISQNSVSVNNGQRYDGTLNELSEDLKAVKTKIGNLSRVEDGVYDELTKEKNIAKNERNEFERSNKKLEQQVGDLEKQLNELEDKNKKLGGQLDVITAERNDLQTEKENLNGEICNKEQKINKLESDVSTKEKELQESENRRSELEEAEQRSQDEIQNLNQWIEALNKDIASKNASIELLQDRERSLVPEFLLSLLDEITVQTPTPTQEVAWSALIPSLYPLRKIEISPDSIDCSTVMFRNLLKYIGTSLNDYLRTLMNDEKQICEMMQKWAQAINQKAPHKAFKLYLPGINDDIDLSTCVATTGAIYVENIRNWGVIDANGNYQVKAEINA